MDPNTLLNYIIGICLIFVSGFIFFRALSNLLKKEREYTKSPFAEKLLRPPGESLRVKIDAIRDEMDNLVLPFCLLYTSPSPRDRG